MPHPSRRLGGVLRGRCSGAARQPGREGRGLPHRAPLGPRRLPVPPVLTPATGASPKPCHVPKPTPRQAVGTLVRQGCLRHVAQRSREGRYLGGRRAVSGVKDPQFLVLLR